MQVDSFQGPVEVGDDNSSMRGSRLTEQYADWRAGATRVREDFVRKSVTLGRLPRRPVSRSQSARGRSRSSPSLPQFADFRLPQTGINDVQHRRRRGRNRFRRGQQLVVLQARVKIPSMARCWKRLVRTSLTAASSQRPTDDPRLGEASREAACTCRERGGQDEAGVGARRTQESCGALRLTSSSILVGQQLRGNDLRRGASCA